MVEPDKQIWGGGRLVLGFILAPIPPAMLVGLWMGYASTGEVQAGLGLAFALAALVLGGYLPMTVIGLPLFYAVRGSKIVRHPLALAAAGAVVATLPTIAIAGWGAAAGEGPGAMMSTVGIVGLLGALAGLTFWATSFWSPRGREGQ